MPRMRKVTRGHRQQMLQLLHYALILARRYGDQEASEDIAQSAMLCFLEAQAHGERIRKPKAWLRTVVRRESSRHFARKKRRRELADILPHPVSQMSLVEWQIAVGEAFSDVSERDRQLLALKLAGYTYREIAERLSIPEDSVGTAVSRAFSHARRVLAS